MEKKLEQGVLTIQLTEKIDTTNAAEVEKELFSYMESDQSETIILDAKNLEYISSMGLRVLLKLKKSVENMEIIHVSMEVYEIFSMTGFTDIMTIKRALREISVDGCEIIGRGGHGTVYRLDGDTIVKLYQEAEPLEDIEREISFAKKAFVHGIPTAISYDMVTCKNQYGVVFELIDADTLTNRLIQEPENYEAYAEKYAQLVQNLHETEADTSEFSNVKDLYHHMTEYMTQYYEPEDIATLHAVIDSVPDRTTFVHGDIHPKNVMVQDGELVLIDMTDLAYGHPIFDYAGMNLTHVRSGANDPKYTKMVIGLDYDLALKLYGDVLRTEFSGYSDAKLERIKKVIDGFGVLKYALSPAINNDPQMIRAIVENAKQYVLPTMKGLIGVVTF